MAAGGLRPGHRGRVRPARPFPHRVRPVLRVGDHVCPARDRAHGRRRLVTAGRSVVAGRASVRVPGHRAAGRDRRAIEGRIEGWIEVRIEARPDMTENERSELMSGAWSGPSGDAIAIVGADCRYPDAENPDARGLDRDRTGVVIGNTMTGEFSRAAALRLRWPYVRRVLGAALAGQGWQADRLADFLGQVEKAYKEPFPAPNDESLAG